MSKRHWLPYLVYAALSLAILGPLLKAGYILTLDMAFTPQFNYASELYGLREGAASTAPFYFLLQIASAVIPVWLLQKVILCLIFFAAGTGMHRLLRSCGWGSYFAGLLYTVNPFTYARFMAGQWVLLASYAVIPFAVKAFLELLERSSLRNAAKVALLATLVGIIQLHGLLILLLVFLIIFAVRVLQQRKEPSQISIGGRYLALAALMTLLLNLHWLLPMLTAESTVLSAIGSQDLFFFAPRPTTTLGVVFDVAAMYGFWRGGIVYVKDLLPFWWLIFIYILYIAIFGLISAVFKRPPDTEIKTRARKTMITGEGSPNPRWLAIAFSVTGIAGFLLALGASSPMTAPFFIWLWENIPFFFRGFRDSQKFVVLLCLSYAYLGGQGVSGFVDLLRHQGRKLVRAGLVLLVALAIAAPLVYGFTIFGGHGQLGVTDYPQEWYEANNYLNSDDDDFRVLFLPWHLYMDFQWLPNADKRLGNPADQFFEKPIIAGDNIELPGLYSQSMNPLSQYVDFLLLNREKITNMGELLAPLNVKYVILVHEVDYPTYDFLEQQQDLSVVMARSNLTLFKNEHNTAAAYGVDSVVYVRDLAEYLELSKEQDVTEHLYILGSGQGTGDSHDSQSLRVTMENPARFLVEGTALKYTVFTTGQKDVAGDWEYNGEQPVANLGFIPAFASDEDGGKIIYSRFYRVYLPCYLASLAALIVTIAICFTGRHVD